jgi:nitroreductase
MDDAALQPRGNDIGSDLAADAPGEIAELALEFIASRRNVSPRRLVEPGPDAEQLERIFAAAAAAPDHGEITPWRFVIVPARARERLAEVFALALLDRDSGATPDQVDAARQKAHRAPLLMLAVARLGTADPDIPAAERLLSLGCAVQNMLLTAHSMGLGCGLTSGQAMASPRMRQLFGLTAGEMPVCCINIGTVTTHKPGRARPAPATLVSSLQ